MAGLTVSRILRWRVRRASCVVCWSCGCETHAWRRLIARKQSKSTGRRRTVESLRRKGCVGSLASRRAVMRMNVEQASKMLVVRADPLPVRGRPCRRSRVQPGFSGLTGVMTTARRQGDRHATTRDPSRRSTGRPTGGPRGPGRVAAEVGEARSTVEAGQCRRREGASLPEKCL